MKKILLIQTAFIGDAILVSAQLESLYKAFPNSSVSLMVRKGNESVYENHPFLQRVFVWDKARKYDSLLENVKKIRTEKFDLVVNFQRFGTTGLLTALSGAKETRGFSKNPFSFLFSKRFPHQIGDGTHEINRNQTIIADVAGEQPQKPRIYPADEDFAKAAFFRSEPYICIAPTSVWFTKQFPEHKWIKFLNHLPGKYRVYLLGAPGDKKACNEIILKAGVKNTENLCGKLSLLQSAALMKGAIMNFVNDSAPMHLCSAVDAPVTAVYCSTVPEFGFGPLSTNSRIVQTRENLTCRPCNLHGKKSCPLGHFECARSIDVAALLNLLPS